MKCDICGVKEATVHLTEIINDKVTKLHLCEDCAREKGQEMEEHFGLSDLLAGLADMGAELKPEVRGIARCGGCGLTFQNFRKIGRLGCSECYEAFKAHLVPILRRIHGSERHVGKVPVKLGKTLTASKLLQELKMRMDKAIQFEEFEEAARLRDEIRKLEKKMREGKGKR